MKKRFFELLRFVPVAIFAFVACMPLIMVISSSFLGSSEAAMRYGGVLGSGSNAVNWSLVPLYPTIKHYVELLLDTPSFFVMFWNSISEEAIILAGQLVVGTAAAWAFARYRFIGSKIIFFVYIVLMIMPFQVTMVSSYLVLDKLSLLDSVWAVTIPNIFSTLPVFIMTKSFSALPPSTIEAARIDGAGELRIFLKIGIPMGVPGILSALVLGFLEYWNNIEQPLTFIKTRSLMPLSMYMSSVTAENTAISMVASVITLLPALLIFLTGQKYLEKGIVASGLKE